MKPKVWMVEEGASGNFDKILIEERVKKSRRLAKVYEIKFRRVEVEKLRNTPREDSFNTRRNIKN